MNKYKVVMWKKRAINAFLFALVSARKDLSFKMFSQCCRLYVKKVKEKQGIDIRYNARVIKHVFNNKDKHVKDIEQGFALVINSLFK